MAYLGNRQRFTPALLVGGATTLVGIANRCEGAIAMLVKYHGGTGGQAATAWVFRRNWDGTTVSSVGNDLIVRGLLSLPLNGTEISGSNLSVSNGSTSLLVPIDVDRVSIQVTLGGASGTNDVTTPIIDVWLLYDDAKQHGPDRLRVGMPTT